MAARFLDEALHVVTESLKDLRKNGEPHRLAVLGGRYRGLMRSLWERFLESFGSPNYVDNQFEREGHRTKDFISPRHPHTLLPMISKMSSTLLCFGSEILESYWSPVQALLAMASCEEEDQGRGENWSTLALDCRSRASRRMNGYPLALEPKGCWLSESPT